MAGYPSEQELDAEFVQDLDWPNFDLLLSECNREIQNETNTEELKKRIKLIGECVRQEIASESYKEALAHLLFFEDFALAHMSVNLFGRVHQFTESLEKLLSNKENKPEPSKITDLV